MNYNNCSSSNNNNNSLLNKLIAIKHGSRHLWLISLYLHSEGVKTGSKGPPPSLLLLLPDDEGGSGSRPSSPRSVACKSFPVRLDKQQRQQWQRSARFSINNWHQTGTWQRGGVRLQGSSSSSSSLSASSSSTSSLPLLPTTIISSSL